MIRNERRNIELREICLEVCWKIAAQTHRSAHIYLGPLEIRMTRQCKRIATGLRIQVNTPDTLSIEHQLRCLHTAIDHRFMRGAGPFRLESRLASDVHLRRLQ